jgi:hypothetical protein
MGSRVNHRQFTTLFVLGSISRGWENRRNTVARNGSIIQIPTEKLREGALKTSGIAERSSFGPHFLRAREFFAVSQTSQIDWHGVIAKRIRPIYDSESECIEAHKNEQIDLVLGIHQGATYEVKRSDINDRIEVALAWRE